MCHITRHRSREKFLWTHLVLLDGTSVYTTSTAVCFATDAKLKAIMNSTDAKVKVIL